MSQHQQNVLQIIAWKLPYLNPALKRIGEYVLNNTEVVKLQKIKSLAENCDVSDATVTRFVREIAFDSFQSFKIALAEIGPEETKGAPISRPSIYDDVSPLDSIEDIIQPTVISSRSKIPAISFRLMSSPGQWRPLIRRP